MNKKKTAITIIVSILLMIIVSCSDMNPFFAGGVVPGGNWIYFSETDQIKRMRLDGSEVENVFTVGYVDIQRIQLDPFRQKIYILNVAPGPSSQIYEYNLDGTEKLELLNLNTDAIFDMKINAASGILYYFDDLGAIGNLRQIDLETRIKKDVHVTASNSTFSMSLDITGNLYYTEGASIYKLDIVAQTSNLFATLGVPGGVALNRDSQSLYAYDGQMIYKFNLPSSTGSMIFNDATISHDKNMEVSILEDKLFFYEMTFPFSLYSINLDGSGLYEIYESNSPLGGFDILSK